MYASTARAGAEHRMIFWAHLHTHYSKSLKLSGARALVDRMTAEKKISEADGTVT
jgi:hypothetical protein